MAGFVQIVERLAGSARPIRQCGDCDGPTMTSTDTFILLLVVRKCPYLAPLIVASPR